MQWDTDFVNDTGASNSKSIQQQIEGNIDVGITIDGVPIDFIHSASDLIVTVGMQ